MSVMVGDAGQRPASCATGARCDGESESDMDPNMNLRRQREILAELREVYEEIEAVGRDQDRRDQESAQHDLLVELAGLTQELDGHLSGGGALPDAWRHQPEVAARTVDHQTTAVTIAGVDVYVRDAGNAVVVSVSIDELPYGKNAWVESFDGVSWEHELP